MLDRVSGKAVAAVAAVLLLAGTLLVFTTGSGTRTLTAHFSRAVSIYKGSEVRVMGVRIGEVTAVVPDGNNVAVTMQYDDQYHLPANAKAAIVTPTLVADRYVQITPAYTGGPVMADGADIPLADTGTPVEMDQIYGSLEKLTQALGPNGANRHGALDAVLSAGAKALHGRGRLANRTLLNLSRAAQTFGDNSGPLFDSVTQMARITGTLSANDRFVSQFIGDLAGVSSELSGERGDMRRALAALASAVHSVRTFVHGNKSLLESDVRNLTRVVGVLAKEKSSLNTVTSVSALALGNLANAFDTKTGSIGARVQFGPTAENLDGVMCDMVVNAGVSHPRLVCQLLKELVAPLKPTLGQVGAGISGQAPQLGGNQPVTSLEGLLGALRKGNGS
ncbi:MAG TPA: MCE family protein [Marmoricola sp.]|nr:MCE family protein [Marmoricola sp.]